MSKHKVFIVDDNQKIISLLEKYLQYESEFEMIGTANDGQEFLNKLNEDNQPDILLLDIVMPNKDGLDVLQELNKSGLIKDMFVIMLTALGQEDIIREAFDLGVNYYVLKPLEPEDVINKMKRLIKNQNENKQTSYETAIQQELHALGVASHLNGFMYLKDSISMVIDNHEMVTQITKLLYPAIAKKYNTTETRVEKSMRTAIEYAYNKGNREYFTKSFFERKPTNGEFIAYLADKIRATLN